MRALRVVAAQFAVSLEIGRNTTHILKTLCQADENEVVVFPEGAISGYDPDASFLDKIDLHELDTAIATIQEEVIARKLHVMVGSCLFENGTWFNTGIYLSHNAPRFVYRKINLATSERGHFQAGDQLPVFSLDMGDFSITAAMQLCREIRFAEQWQYLARSGAEVFFFLTNAIGFPHALPVWRSHLISRAAEMQRFVVAVNNADDKQICPTMIIEPFGEVAREEISGDATALRATLDLSRISNWYLDQARTDVVHIAPGSN